MDTQLAKYLPVFRQQMDKLVIFSDQEWAVLKPFLQLRTLKKKEHFVHAGRVCKELGFIISGAVRLYHIKDGEEITGYFCQDNEFISSYKSFLTQTPSIPSIQAIDDLLLITLTHQTLQQLYDDPIIGHKMERFSRLIAEQLISCYEDRVQAFVTQSPEERYAAIISCNPAMLQHIPQHYLANYLGITAVSLSRIRKRLVSPGR